MWKAYEALTGLFNQAMLGMLPFDNATDGLGLEDRVQTKKQATGMAVRQIDNVHPDAATSGQSRPMAGLEAPTKMRNPGRLTNARDSAPYEGMSKWSRFCGICRIQGHKRVTCLQRRDTPKVPRKDAKCTNCGVAGHRKNTCDR